MKPVKYQVTKLDWCKESAVVPVEVFEDHRLSWGAKGVFGYLCTREGLDPVELNEVVLASTWRDLQSEEITQDRLDELIALGYVERVQHDNPS